MDAAKRTSAELLTQHALAVRLYAAKVAPRPDMAEDIAQKACVVALQKLGSYDASRSFLAWMHGIVNNIARNEWDRLALHTKVERDGLAAYVEQLAAAPSDLDRIETLEVQRQALAQCLQLLPPRGQTIIQLHYGMDLAYSEIAAKVGTSVDAVKMALVRLRQGLRQCVHVRLSEAGL